MNEAIDFKIEWNGDTYAGSYWTHDELITVKSATGRESCTQIGGTPPPALAKILLREMVENER